MKELLLLLLSGAVVVSVAQDDIGIKAASNFVNCGCQCVSVQIEDQQGRFHGNCARTDFTGATWCYVDKFDHTCQDAFNSDRYPNLKVSYEACTTPRCRGNRPFNNNGFNNNGFNNGGFNNGGGLLGILGGGGGGGGTEVIISGAGGGFNNNGRRPNRNRNRPNRNRNRNRNRDRNRGDVILIDARDNQDDQSGDAITFSQ